MQRASDCVESRVNSLHVVVNLLRPVKMKHFIPWTEGGDLDDLTLICDPGVLRRSPTL